jgi:hypothetical protein
LNLFYILRGLEGGPERGPERGPDKGVQLLYPPIILYTKLIVQLIIHSSNVNYMYNHYPVHVNIYIIYTYTHTYIYTCIYVYIYIVAMCTYIETSKSSKYMKLEFSLLSLRLSTAVL